MPKLSAIILTRNEAAHIQDCIACLRFAEHILVFDSGSTDGTPELAKEAGAEVRFNPFESYAQQRNDALAAIESEWVLFVDADERIPAELATEVLDVLQNPLHGGYYIPRHNYIFGKLTRHAGWYPDYQMRLLNPQEAHYDPAKQVHEVVILKKGEAGYLQNHITHYNYDSLAQFHGKQRRYSAYDAQILYQEGIQPKIYTPYTQAIRHFKWRFWDLQGWRDGGHGLRLCGLMAWYEYRKYQQLAQLRKA